MVTQYSKKREQHLKHELEQLQQQLNDAQEESATKQDLQQMAIQQMTATIKQLVSDKLEAEKQGKQAAAAAAAATAKVKGLEAELGSVQNLAEEWKYRFGEAVRAAEEAAKRDREGASDLEAAHREMIKAAAGAAAARVKVPEAEISSVRKEAEEQKHGFEKAVRAAEEAAKRDREGAADLEAANREMIKSAAGAAAARVKVLEAEISAVRKEAKEQKHGFEETVKAAEEAAKRGREGAADLEAAHREVTEAAAARVKVLEEEISAVRKEAEEQKHRFEEAVRAAQEAATRDREGAADLEAGRKRATDADRLGVLESVILQVRERLP